MKLAVDIAFAAALSAAVLYGGWHWFGPFGLVFGAPILALFGRPLVEILTSLPAHIGYIIIEHDMDVALRVVESVTMMHNGRIFKEGLPHEIESDPEVQELYLGGGHE